MPHATLLSIQSFTMVNLSADAGGAVKADGRGGGLKTGNTPAAPAPAAPPGPPVPVLPVAGAGAGRPPAAA